MYASDTAQNAIDNNAVTPETIWDAVSLGMSADELRKAIQSEDTSQIILSATALGIDIIAVSLPIIPGGAGAILKAKNAAKAADKVYKHSYRYSEKVLKKANRKGRTGKKDIGHNFPYSFDDKILKTKPEIKNSGYWLYKKPGTLNRTKGLYEIGVNPKTKEITHRVFIKGKK